MDILDHFQKPMPVSLKRDGPWVSDDEFGKDIAENLFNMWLIGTGHYGERTNKRLKVGEILIKFYIHHPDI